MSNIAGRHFLLSSLKCRDDICWTRQLDHTPLRVIFSCFYGAWLAEGAFPSRRIPKADSDEPHCILKGRQSDILILYHSIDHISQCPSPPQKRTLPKNLKDGWLRVILEQLTGTGKFAVMGSCIIVANAIAMGSRVEVIYVRAVVERFIAATRLKWRLFARWRGEERRPCLSRNECWEIERAGVGSVKIHEDSVRVRVTTNPRAA
ncbi:hypothetical protein FN846DRAFT_603713 [Sphaerosporella brunnea]|uniref:Uncharacterized protein n=1 Tax=Sphaerosporella brunnea TaxID=1250544 RepID=A0A5J5F2C5_9PEZI|nr:hypothetical protein FN846DRAFT_603713 [Sphaerosporella brunnea]